MSWKFIVIAIALIVFAFLFKSALSNSQMKDKFEQRGIVIAGNIKKTDSLRVRSENNEKRIDTLIILINKLEAKKQ